MAGVSFTGGQRSACGAVPNLWSCDLLSRCFGSGHVTAITDSPHASLYIFSGTKAGDDMDNALVRFWRADQAARLLDSLVMIGDERRAIPPYAELLREVKSLLAPATSAWN